MVLGTTLAVGLAFVAAVRLVGLWVAFIGFLLIAFDPFHAGLTRILHHDGLESGLMFLSFLSFLVFCLSRALCNRFGYSGFISGIKLVDKITCFISDSFLQFDSADRDPRRMAAKTQYQGEKTAGILFGRFLWWWGLGWSCLSCSGQQCGWTHWEP